MVNPPLPDPHHSFISVNKQYNSFRITNNGGIESERININEFAIFVNNKMIGEHVSLPVGITKVYPGTPNKDSLLIIGKFYDGSTRILVNTDI
jgi:hypothetical protein